MLIAKANRELGQGYDQVYEAKVAAAEKVMDEETLNLLNVWEKGVINSPTMPTDQRVAVIGSLISTRIKYIEERISKSGEGGNG